MSGYLSVRYCCHLNHQQQHLPSIKQMLAINVTGIVSKFAEWMNERMNEWESSALIS